MRLAARPDRFITRLGGLVIAAAPSTGPSASFTHSNGTYVAYGTGEKRWYTCPRSAPKFQSERGANARWSAWWSTIVRCDVSSGARGTRQARSAVRPMTRTNAAASAPTSALGRAVVIASAPDARHSTRASGPRHRHRHGAELGKQKR